MREFLDAIGDKIVGILGLMPAFGDFMVGSCKCSIQNNDQMQLSLIFSKTDCIHFNFKRETEGYSYNGLITDVYGEDYAGGNVISLDGQMIFTQVFQGDLNSQITFGWDIIHAFYNLDWVNVFINQGHSCASASYNRKDNYVLQIAHTVAKCHPRQLHLPPVIKSCYPYMTTRLLGVPVAWSNFSASGAAMAVLERFPIDDFINTLRTSGYTRTSD